MYYQTIKAMIIFLSKKKLIKKLNQAKLSRSMADTREERMYFDGIVSTLEHMLGEKTLKELFWW